MNHYGTAFAVSLILFIAALPANAQDRTGLAVHGGIGASLIKDRDGFEAFEGSGFGYSFGLEYRFVPRFALGLEIFHLGTGSDTVGSVDTEIEAGGTDLFGRLIFPLSDAVEVYGRVSGAVYDADVTPGLNTGLFGEDACLEFFCAADRPRHFYRSLRAEPV